MSMSMNLETEAKRKLQPKWHIKRLDPVCEKIKEITNRILCSFFRNKHLDEPNSYHFSLKIDDISFQVPSSKSK